MNVHSHPLMVNLCIISLSIVIFLDNTQEGDYLLLQYITKPPNERDDMKPERTIKTISAVKSLWIGKECWYAIRQIDYKDGRSERFTDTRTEYPNEAEARRGHV